MFIGPRNSGTSTLLKVAETLDSRNDPALVLEPPPCLPLFENVLHEMQKVIYYGISKGYLFHNDVVKV
jgi:hypothetical protein